MKLGKENKEHNNNTILLHRIYTQIKSITSESALDEELTSLFLVDDKIEIPGSDKKGWAFLVV